MCAYVCWCVDAHKYAWQLHESEYAYLQKATQKVIGVPHARLRVARHVPGSVTAQEHVNNGVYKTHNYQIKDMLR